MVPKGRKETDMKRLFLVALMILVSMVAVLPVSKVAAQKAPGIPQKLLGLQDSLNSLSGSVLALQNSLNALSGDVSALQSSVDGIYSGGVSCNLRRYYVTKDNFDGSETLTACTTGFHMANLFEVLDVSGLQYDTTLGAMRDDSGLGPPTHHAAWIRTGWFSSSGIGPQQRMGRSNCEAWTSKDSVHYGTWLYLKNHWNDQPAEDGVDRVAPWSVSMSTQCNLEFPVWCVEDL